jgi:hypothetical protein
MLGASFARVATSTSAVEVLRDIYARRCHLTVRTRTEVHDHKEGAQTITYADKLQVRGQKSVPPELEAAIVEHRDELLAAACVISLPVPWLKTLVERHQTGQEVEVRREGWKGPYRVRLAMVAANVASFIGRHPTNDGPRLEPIIREVLR